MYPSKSDHDRTGGLCGTLNGNRNDDFMDKDGNLLNGNEEFNRYWRYVHLNINFLKVKTAFAFFFWSFHKNLATKITNFKIMLSQLCIYHYMH